MWHGAVLLREYHRDGDNLHGSTTRMGIKIAVFPQGWGESRGDITEMGRKILHHRRS